MRFSPEASEGGEESFVSEVQDYEVYPMPPPGVPHDEAWRVSPDYEQEDVLRWARSEGWDGKPYETDEWMTQTKQPWPGYEYSPETWRPNWGDPMMSPLGMGPDERRAELARRAAKAAEDAARIKAEVERAASATLWGREMLPPRPSPPLTAAERAAIDERAAQEKAAVVAAERKAAEDAARMKAERDRQAKDRRDREKNPRIAVQFIYSRKMLDAETARRGRRYCRGLDDGVAERLWPKRRKHDDEPPLDLDAVAAVKRDGAADLARARGWFEAAGATVIPTFNSAVEGFLALGAVPTGDDPTRDALGWSRLFNEGGGLHEAGCGTATAFLTNFRAASIFEREDSSYYSMSIYDPDCANNDPDDTRCVHTDDVTWRLMAPAAYSLAKGEPVSALVDKLPALPFTGAELARLSEQAGGNPDTLARILKMRRAVMGHDKRDLSPMWVEGLIPRGQVIPVGGRGGAGKSSLAQQFAAAITGDAEEVLGYRISRPDGPRGIAVFLSAEDDDDRITLRTIGFVEAGLGGMVIPLHRSEFGSLEAALAHIQDTMLNVWVLIVDPWSMWLPIGADENAAGPTNQTFALLQEFARRGPPHQAKPAVLVLAHTGKGDDGKKPARDMRRLIRGSQALDDRSRLTLGLVRRTDGTSTLAVSKSNLQPQIPLHEVVLTFDPETGMHHRAGAVPGKRQRPPQAADGLDRGTGADSEVAAATVARMAGEGVVIRRTGERSLFALKPPEVVGWPRSRVGNAVTAAVAAGMLVDGSGGLTPPTS